MGCRRQKGWCSHEIGRLITAERTDELRCLNAPTFTQLVEVLVQVETVPCSGLIPLMATHR